MLDPKIIMNLTLEDALLLDELFPIMKSAIEFERIIKDCYSFRIGEKEKTVVGSSDDSERVVLTNEGIIIFYKENKVDFEVTCDFDGISKIVNANFLLSNGIIKQCVTSDSTKTEENALNDEKYNVQNYSEDYREIVEKANQYSRFLEFLVKTDNQLKLATVEPRR